MAAEPARKALVLRPGAIFADRNRRAFLLAVPPGYLHTHTFNDPDQLRKLAVNGWSSCRSVELNANGYHVLYVDQDPKIVRGLAYTVGENLVGYRRGKDDFTILRDSENRNMGYQPSAAGISFHFESNDAANLIKRALRLMNPLMHVCSYSSEKAVRVLGVFRRVPTPSKNDVLVEQARALVEPALVSAVDFASKIESCEVMCVFKVHS